MSEITGATERIGVHKRHCCVKHGCKYGYDDCPVVSGSVVQDYPCESCDGVMPSLTGWRFTDCVILYKCPKCGAEPGYHCVRPSGREAREPHGQREGLLPKTWGKRIPGPPDPQQRLEWIAAALHGDAIFGPAWDDPLFKQVKDLQARLYEGPYISAPGRLDEDFVLVARRYVSDGAGGTMEGFGQSNTGTVSGDVHPMGSSGDAERLEGTASPGSPKSDAHSQLSSLQLQLPWPEQQIVDVLQEEDVVVAKRTNPNHGYTDGALAALIAMSIRDSIRAAPKGPFRMEPGVNDITWRVAGAGGGRFYGSRREATAVRDALNRVAAEETP